MRLLICGSRTWWDPVPIAAVLAACPPDTTVVHGDARGADRLAAGLARLAGLAVEAHPADWTRDGRAAGPRRNAAMLATGIDQVVAFRVDGASPGTDHMVRIARKAGVPVRIISGEPREVS